MKAVLIVLGVLLLIVLLVGGSLMGTRNQLVVLRESVNGAWSQVDVDLQRRADLIPNLVETVKGYAKQEQEVFGAIANARSALLNARNPQEKIAANQSLDSAIGRLLVVVENYPQLKSNENFLRLQDELANTENKLQNARRGYNEAVQQYNRDLQIFPKNIAAGMFGFQPAEYYRADPNSRAVPKVQF